MGTWIGFILTIPMTLLSGTMVLQFYLDKESVTRMSLKSRDVRIAIQLMILGFVFEAVSRFVSLLPGSSSGVAFYAGIGTTVMLTASFLLMNIVMHGPDNPFYRLLPSNLLD